ncbi:MAG: hypothetical protein AAGI88_19410 [Pseudomonadota bacterium]
MSNSLARERCVTIGLLVLIAAHLVLGAIEVLHRPVFPWDAWLNWMYRAKAWYLSGQISDFDPVTLWSSGAEPTNDYAVAGHHYPRLLPLIAYGMAKVLGGWNEPLVSLPYIFLGSALGVGSFALARRHGLSKTASLVVTYLTVSLPLVGTHLSLAGQADIWMAATSGLGFVAVCSGLINRNNSNLLLGMTLVGLGAMFKVEGTLWLVAAVALVFSAILGRRGTLVVMTVASCVLLLGVLTGIYGLHVPGLGAVGLLDGRLHIPLIGSYLVQLHDIGDDYLANFLLGASWNLLWYMVAGALAVSLFTIRRSREAAVFLSFFILITVSQALIFVFTEQGAWAEDWTAINRLPLQFAPALVFASVCLLLPNGGQSASAVAESSTRTAKRTVTAINTGAVVYLIIAVLGAGALLLSVTGNTKTDDSVRFSAQQMQQIQGRWAPYSGGVSVQRFDENVAIVSTGRVTLDANRFQSIRISGTGSNRSQITLFWRRAGEPELHSKTLAGLGNLYTRMSEDPSWQGAVSELGLVVYDDGGTAKLEFIELEPDSVSSRIKQFFASRLWVTPWSQKSVNWLPGSNPAIDVYAPLISLALALLIGIAVANFGRCALAPALLGAGMGAWVLLDSTWLYQRVVLGRETVETYAGAPEGVLRFGADEITYRATARAICDLAPKLDAPDQGPLSRLAIASDSDKEMSFQLLRAKYHALPIPAYAHEAMLDSIPPDLADRILVLKLRYGGATAIIRSSLSASSILASKTGRPVRVAWENEDAFMLLIGEEEGQSSPTDLAAGAKTACWQADSM